MHALEIFTAQWPARPIKQEHQQQTEVEVDAAVMEILSGTQNECLLEMGYHPTLLQEHRELQKRCNVLRSDNEKLYRDNHTLAQYLKAQEHQLGQLKNSDQLLRAHARALTAERDEIAGRLHVAYVFSPGSGHGPTHVLKVE